MREVGGKGTISLTMLALAVAAIFIGNYRGQIDEVRAGIAVGRGQVMAGTCTLKAVQTDDMSPEVFEAFKKRGSDVEAHRSFNQSRSVTWKGSTWRAIGEIIAEDGKSGLKKTLQQMLFCDGKVLYDVASVPGDAGFQPAGQFRKVSRIDWITPPAVMYSVWQRDLNEVLEQGKISAVKSTQDAKLGRIVEVDLTTPKEEMAEIRFAADRSWSVVDATVQPTASPWKNTHYKQHIEEFRQVSGVWLPARAWYAIVQGPVDKPSITNKEDVAFAELKLAPAMGDLHADIEVGTWLTNGDTQELFTLGPNGELLPRKPL